MLGWRRRKKNHLFIQCSLLHNSFYIKTSIIKRHVVHFGGVGGIEFEALLKDRIVIKIRTIEKVWFNQDTAFSWLLLLFHLHWHPLLYWLTVLTNCRWLLWSHSLLQGKVRKKFAKSSFVSFLLSISPTLICNWLNLTNPSSSVL